MKNLLAVNKLDMENLNSKELIEISGGTTDLGSWLVNKVGDFVCWAKTSLENIDLSLLQNFSHGTYPGNLK